MSTGGLRRVIGAFPYVKEDFAGGTDFFLVGKVGKLRCHRAVHNGMSLLAAADIEPVPTSILFESQAKELPV